jgi:hypothetical protein
MNEPRKVLVLREPVWTTERGDKIPLSQIKNDHLRRIERWLRGWGKTTSPGEMYAFWYGTIRAELDKRRLIQLPNHPNTKKIRIEGELYKWNQRTHEWDITTAPAHENI